MDVYGNAALATNEIRVYFNVLSPWITVHWVGGLPIMPYHIWYWVPWWDFDGDGTIDTWLYDPEFEDTLYGCGPYIFDHRIPGVEILLKAYKRCYGKRGYFNSKPKVKQKYQKVVRVCSNMYVLFEAELHNINANPTDMVTIKCRSRWKNLKTGQVVIITGTYTVHVPGPPCTQWKFQFWSSQPLPAYGVWKLMPPVVCKVYGPEPRLGPLSWTNVVHTMQEEQLMVGDVDMNGIVDIFDLVAVAIWYGQTVPPAPVTVDITSPGIIDIFDIVAIATNYGMYP